ncbi:CatB-related O-acetyltransferase [Sediminicola luteus]|uniref:CatB-related O-acetyltransferase n=1 Tax=Sediminicola luteus TaxID=319238 RepID=A0ABV2TXR9_9FLAO
MKTSQLVTRILWIPFGLIRGLLDLANQKARDIDNRRRFPQAIIDQNSSFTNGVTIGKNSHICSNCIVNNSHVGSYSYVNYGTLIQNTTIGNYCSIAHHVKIGLGAHPLNMFSTSPIFYKTKNALNVRVLQDDLDFQDYAHITIGSDVWIGANAIIMDGVTIGHGAVVAAGAIVSKNVPAYAIVGGVPAKIIRYRFTEEQRKAILKTRWWEKNAIDVQAMKDNLTEIVN